MDGSSQVDLAEREAPEDPPSPDVRGSIFIGRVLGNWGEYMLVPKWREWALKKLGVDNLILGVDLFATPWTTAAPLFISKGMDAFTFDWGSLQQSESHLLWANPHSQHLTKWL